MSPRIINRIRITVLGILTLGLCAFGPLLFGLDAKQLELLTLFTLLNAVAFYALIPFFMPWIVSRDLRQIQEVLNGLKQGNFRVPIQVAPEPADPYDEEYELNRLKRDIERMRASIRARDEMMVSQNERIMKLNHALREEAITDKLTGLYNSRYFWDYIGQLFANYQRHGQPFSFVILDIDFFKKINDTHGHLGGDRVLARVGELLRENIRDTDLAARLGGEEFALILPALSPKATETFLARLIGLIRDTPIALDDECHIHITVSMGYYILGQTEAETEALDSAQEIVKRADEALYWVKRNGRNGALSWEDLKRLDKPFIKPVQGQAQRDQACCLKGCLAERLSERGG